MKNSLLTLVVAGSFVLPAVTQAETPAAVKKAKNQQTAAVSTLAAKPNANRVIYYISTEPGIGSHIPMVRRVYGGRIDSAASPAVYGSTRIEQTGALDVGTALYRLDASISLKRSH